MGYNSHHRLAIIDEFLFVSLLCLHKRNCEPLVYYIHIFIRKIEWHYPLQAINNIFLSSQIEIQTKHHLIKILHIVVFNEHWSLAHCRTFYILNKQTDNPTRIVRGWHVSTIKQTTHKRAAEARMIEERTTAPHISPSDWPNQLHEFVWKQDMAIIKAVASALSFCSLTERDTLRFSCRGKYATMGLAWKKLRDSISCLIYVNSWNNSKKSLILFQ